MSVTAKKEWIGESGYCNCLLVIMSRVPILSMHLFSHHPVPDLDTLTAHKQSTAAWIRAQEFQYSTLNPLTVIKTLSQMVGITNLSQWYPCEIHDVVEDDGPIVQRIFRLRLSKEEDVFTLEIKMDSTQKTVKS